MIDPAAALTLRLLLAAVLARAAWHKARDLRAFAAAVADYRLLPGAWAAAAAAGFLVAEIGLAGGLLLPPVARAASLGAGALLCLYAAAIGTNLLRGRRHIDCGCAGPARRQPLSGWLVARNGALVAAAMAAALPAAPRALGGLDLFTVAAGAVALLAASVAADGLVAAWPDTARLRRAP